jgi:Asp-tRNA(Asn)/Glu-tRNA(Gln) amidotransferase C subunit
MIEIKEIEKLAELSRIKLTSSEQEQMRNEIVSILGYIDQIQQISSGSTDVASSTAGTASSTAGTASSMIDVAGSTNVQASKTAPRPKELVRNVLREDANPHESATFTEAILKNAPSRQGDYFKVKKILG